MFPPHFLSDPFDFEANEYNEKSLNTPRIPVAYPILCGHILTHTVGALIAVTGRARTEGGKHNIGSVVTECKYFLQIGLSARVAQIILAVLKDSFTDDPLWEQHAYLIVKQDLEQLCCATDPNQKDWEHFAVGILRALLSPSKADLQTKSSQPSQSDVVAISTKILRAIEEAKSGAIAFLRDISLVYQVLIPNIFSSIKLERSNGSCHSNDSTVTLLSYMELFQIDNLGNIIESSLLKEIIGSWYATARGNPMNWLDFPREFNRMTWPISPHSVTLPSSEVPKSYPLLRNHSSGGSWSLPCVTHLPKSYTDLYASISELCPEIEQTALCLVCGQVTTLLF